uniref:Group II intron maturase-specific domain-containing protein n=1 Tax=Ostreobium sp. HV05007bc TaxID=1940403 RepID=A0A1X9ZI20_9CHLO|nr:hypothetical protein [Ostreobium sp. HV05007bc]
MNIYFYQKSKNTKTIDWYRIHKRVFKLQIRIVKQLKKKNFRQVRNLQRLILKNFGSKLLASQKIINKDSVYKFNMYKNKKNNLFLNSLNLNNFIQLQKYDNYNPLNEDSKNFPNLQYSQFLQFLWVLALLPINETLSEPLSYNYRLYRIQVDILKELYFTFNFTHYNWLMVIKPYGFFKNKNEQWLSKNVFLEKKFLNFIIKNEKFATLCRKYYNHKEVIETRKISLIKLIKSSCFYSFALFKKQNLVEIASSKITKNELLTLPIIFYNDLILIPGKNLVNLKKIYKLTFQFLNQRGLVIKKNRFWVINLLSGFNFLGWSLKKRKGRLIIKISRENIKSHQTDIKKFLKSARFLPIDKVIIKLNEKIISWQSYYSYTPNLYKTWSEMNYYLFWQVWRWCRKRHKNKGVKWLYNRYWYSNEKNKWVFHSNMQYLKKYKSKCIKIMSLPGSINVCEIKSWKDRRRILLMRVTNI